MALFALSCVGLLIFLWISFGGSVPFAAQGYLVRVAFPYADQLADQAQVRIAGVNVGTVIGKSLDPRANRVIATLDIQRRYAPLHADARAILRIKTLLGETYVQITPGTPSAPAIRDGGMLNPAHVVSAVQLDQIYDAFDPSTRRAFQQWQEELASSLKGNGQNLNDVLGNLPTFAGNASQILHVLDVQEASTIALLRGGSTVFAAINRDPAQLRALITTGESTLHATAQQSAALAATFRNFPEFLNQSRQTFARLQSFATNTDPVVRELEPVATKLAPTLHSVKELSPYLRTFFTKLSPLISVSRTGLPAYTHVINGAQPLLGALAPFLQQLNPILGWLSLHQQLISDFLSQGATALAATTTTFGGGNQPGHYLRQFSPIGPETLSLAPARDQGNRGDTYPPPLWIADPANLQRSTLGSWDCKNTPTGGPVAANNSPLLGYPACWLEPTLPGAKAGQIPHLTPSITTGGL
jgi:phospholipid/cholesterol/gamma-HCH transport system substrate-binding protein